MKIGYLHLGAEQHGIRRYSEYLAAEAKRRLDLSVVEATIIPTSDQPLNQQQFIDAAQQLSGADVVHFQFSRSLLKGENFRSIRQYLRSFKQTCAVPLVVTLHDIPAQYQAPKAEGSLWSQMHAFLKHSLGRNGFLLWWVISQCQLTLVCNREEQRRLQTFASSYWLRALKQIKVIPHFVEQRTIAANSTAIRANLGLSHVRTITLLGWIFGSKGHELAIAALAELPEDVMLIFAGSPPADGKQFVDVLLKQAENRGVRDRIRITGYLSDTEQEHYMLATDLAICPFKETSASGSLSTWISVGRPILASDLPQIHDYNQLRAGAIHTFQPYTPTALAAAIRQLLPRCTEAGDQDVAQLREQLNIKEIFDRHLIQYQQVAHYQTQHSSARKNLFRGREMSALK